MENNNNSCRVLNTTELKWSQKEEKMHVLALILSLHTTNGLKY